MFLNSLFNNISIIKRINNKPNKNGSICIRYIVIPAIQENIILLEGPKTSLRITNKKNININLLKKVKDIGLLCESVRLKLYDWAEYKEERGELYTETTANALVRDVSVKCKMHPAIAICELIDTCMASGYQGIVWERIDKNRGLLAFRENKYDQKELERLSLGGGYE